MNFEGRVVVVYVNSGGLFRSGQTGWTLDSPRFEEQLGRTFLVGRAIADQPDIPTWHHGASINIPWESVSYYYVFDSIEAYREAVARSRSGARRTWFTRGRGA